MDLISIMAIALGLSFDSFAVSLSCGVIESKIRFRNALRIASVFALFQGGLTVLGFFLGYSVTAYIERIDHWVAFALLSLLGVRMIMGGIQDSGKRKPVNLGSWQVLLTMAVGTSIDAFAVGISFAFLNVKIWLAGLMIALVTMLASMTAIRIGKSAGGRLGSKVEIIGGIILIIIGVRILIEHLTGVI